MKNKCTIVTSNCIEGASITEYLGLVSANVVLGVNAFDDFFASFSDFFGGHSGAYQKQMTSLFNEAVYKLAANASMVKADAVISTKVDFDEISGKNKQMFMVTITGTAVKLSYGSQSKLLATDKEVSQTELEEQMRRMRIKSILIESAYGLNKEDWQFLKSHDGDIFCQALADIAIKRMEIDPTSTFTSEFVDNYREIYENLAPDKQSEIFYKCYNANSTLSLKVHKGFPYFSALSAVKLIPSDTSKEEEMNSFLEMINAPSRSYSEMDLDCMQKIFDSLMSMPEIWRKEERSKLLGGKVMKTVCVCGATFDDEDTCPSCGKDKQGYSGWQRKLLEEYGQKVAALATVFLGKN